MQDAFLADRVQRIEPSPSVAARNLVSRLVAEGRDIISLTIGEPDFPTPEHVIDAAFEGARRGETHYSSGSGIPELREAVIKKFRTENQLSASEDTTTIGVGAKQLIFNALAASVGRGDEVLIPAPYWVSYPDIVKLHGGKPVVITGDPSNSLKATAKSLHDAITPKTKWLLLNTPNNPSGAVYTRDELKEILEVLKANEHVWVLTDEIYEHFAFDGRKAVSIASLDEEVGSRTLTVNGVSKAYAMTGWRIGFACGPRLLISAINKITSQSTTCPCSVSQVAAAAALNGPQDFVTSMAARFAARRDLVAEKLDAIPGVDCSKSEGSFYLFPQVTGLLGTSSTSGNVIETDLDLAEYLSEEAGVATIGGSSFGVGGHIRCSLAVEDKKLEEACRRIAEACAKLS